MLDFLCAHIRQATSGSSYQAEHKTEPSEEIQSLLTLLFTEEHDVFEDCPINLQGSYLNGATLVQARLKKANLREAQLQDADLKYARLQGADLYKARLQKADLMEAQLERAELELAEMQRANLSAARMQGARLSVTQLQGAKLMNAELQGANLKYARLQGATLWQAQMQGADLFRVQLQGADLGVAQLQGAILMETQLQGVSSPKAHPLPSAGFESRIRNRIGKFSDLTGIFFSGGLRQKDLDFLCEGLSAGQDQALRKTLRPHVGQPASNELPSDSGVETGAYTQEEAEQWIAEYNKAMEKAPSADDTANADSAPDSDKGKVD